MRGILITFFLMIFCSILIYGNIQDSVNTGNSNRVIVIEDEINEIDIKLLLLEQQQQYTEANIQQIREAIQEKKVQRIINIVIPPASLLIAFAFLIATIISNRSNQKTIDIQRKQLSKQILSQESLNTKQTKLIQEQITYFQQQITQYQQQNKITQAAIKPIILGAKTASNKKTSLKMTNYGGGPAVISKIEFVKDGLAENTISKLIDISQLYPLLFLTPFINLTTKQDKMLPPF